MKSLLIDIVNLIVEPFNNKYLNLRLQAVLFIKDNTGGYNINNKNIFGMYCLFYGILLECMLWLRSILLEWLGIYEEKGETFSVF